MSDWFSGELMSGEPFKTNLIPVYKIKFSDASFSVNPAIINAKTVLTVFADEETIYVRELTGEV